MRIDSHTAFDPDALVYCGPRLSFDAMEVPEPAIVVEVLSEGTQARDHRAKLGAPSPDEAAD